MVEPIRIADAFKKAQPGDSISVRGWIYRTRSSGGIVFTVLRDSTGILQCTVIKGELPEEDFKSAEKALVESSVIVEGVLREDKRAPGGREITAKKFNVVHFAERFPIFKDQTEEFLLDNRHLWLRSREMTATMKVKAMILRAAREWFFENGFIETTPPILTENACEGGSTLFELKYFEKKGYLSQSAQLYLEALIFSLEKVWSLTPSFRAEKSRTPRHLAEFWHLEEEAAWVTLSGNLEIQEQLVSYICQYLAKNSREELEFLGRNPDDLKVIEPPFQRISYTKAVDILRDKGYEFRWGDDFGTNEERELSMLDNKPVFIIRYPAEIKPFYMKITPDNPKTVENADMLAPEGVGEIIGGSERETNIESMKERLLRENANLENYQWYFDLRKFGSVPHSGFGLGIERVVRWIGKREHIRDTVPFPRTVARLSP
ncbi:MAG: asparagine--tRNA ligase [Thermoplasmata archaeon]|nr:asparagine--tRNA ligase [Thermoplasmata archaeon]